MNYACYTNQGEYVVTGVSVEELSATEIPAGCSVFYGQVDAASQYHDIINNTPVTKPPRPDYDHKFNYVTKQWELDIPQAITTALVKREQLLMESDWTDTLSAQTRLGSAYDAWQIYRQALRDITDQPGYPGNITWPTKPS